jgi:hypothetical protein
MKEVMTLLLILFYMINAHRVTRISTIIPEDFKNVALIFEGIVCCGLVTYIYLN